MRTNMMGELYLGPDDDLDNEFEARDISTDVYAHQLEFSSIDDAPIEGWGCEIALNEDGETVAYLEGFEDEQMLREYLTDYQIEVA